MADSAKGGNGSSGQPPKELSMEIRLLLAFLLMGAVMFVTPYLPWFKTTPPPGSKPPEVAVGSPGTAPGQPGTTPGQPPAAAPEAPAQPAPAAEASPSSA